MRVLACAVFLLFAAHSQQPTPTPLEPAKKHQDETTPKNAESKYKQQPPANSSPVVDPPASITAAQSKQSSSTNNKANAAPDRWSIVASILNLVFSACLVLLMYLQWRSMREQATYMRRQVEHMKAGLEVSRQAANAADKSASAAESSATVARESSESAATVLAEAAKINTSMLAAMQATATAQENANKLKISQSQIDSINRASDH